MPYAATRLPARYGYGGKIVDYFFIAGTTDIVVIDYSASLQMRIHGYCPEIFKSFVFQVFAYFFGQIIACRNLPTAVTRINNGFSAAVSPQVFGKAAVFLRMF